MIKPCRAKELDEAATAAAAAVRVEAEASVLCWWLEHIAAAIWMLLEILES